MKNIVFCWAGCMVAVLSVFGQEDKPANWKYRGLVQGGLVVGANGPGYQLQTVQGVYKNRWFTGLAAGYDSYQMPGALIGMHGSYALGGKKLQPYLLAQAGPFIPVRSGMWDTKLWNSQGYIFDLKTGWWAQGGAGIGWPVGKKGKQLHLSAVYSLKQGNYRENSWFWIGPIPGPGPIMPVVPPSYYSDNRLTMHRVVIQVGFQW